MTGKVKFVYAKECDRISDVEKEKFRLGTFNMKKIFGKHIIAERHIRYEKLR